MEATGGEEVCRVGFALDQCLEAAADGRDDHDGLRRRHTEAGHRRAAGYRSEPGDDAGVGLQVRRFSLRLRSECR